ncbi:MAG: CinA family protein [Pararhodobacter sp.]
MSVDLIPLATEVLALARQHGLRIATAESCTAGLLVAALTTVSGSAKAVDRGFVTYSNAAKREMLGVRKATLDAHGAVSEETAREMALGALAHSAAQLAVSITGIAGPGGSEFKPEGRVCFGIARKGECRTLTIEFGAPGRTEVRAASVLKALELLREAASQP